MRTIILFLLLTLCPVVLQAELLLGTSWSSTRQLEQIAAAGLRVRYIAPQVAFISGDEHTIRQLESWGLELFLVDEAGEQDAYFFAHHLIFPLDFPAIEVYEDPAGWILLRLARQQVRTHLRTSCHHSLWALPESYRITAWLRTKRQPKPAILLSAADMEGLLSQVDPARLQDHVEALALKDPEQDPTPDNLRTRFTLHPQTLESTEYIRSQLAAALGAEAVEVQEFGISRQELARHLGARFELRDFEGLEDSTAYNVVGTLRGSDPAAGSYIICAHYDATAVRSRNWEWLTQPAPGADDNATGVALVLESARVLAGQQFPWSIRFIAFSGEELGLLGSRNYAARALEKDDRILGVLNFDMIGFNDLSQRLELVTNAPSRWLVELMVEANERYAIGLKLDLLEDGAALLSDHAPFWARGYDAMLGIENYLPTDSTTYGVRNGDYRPNTQYHNVADVPDSINWELVRRTTQLAVATLGQYGLEEGLPNLVVFGGDLSSDAQDGLRVRISNIGLGRLDTPFQVQVWRCDKDSTGCEVIYDEEQSESLAPGAVKDIEIDWSRFGETVFRFEVDPQNRISEVNEEDNLAFQQIRLVPSNDVVAFPNPYRPGRDKFLSFSGLPLQSRVRILALNGELIWSAAEERQGRLTQEIRWHGQNESGFVVNSGVYVYIVTTREGELIEKSKIAVVR